MQSDSAAQERDISLTAESLVGFDSGSLAASLQAMTSMIAEVERAAAEAVAVLNSAFASAAEVIQVAFDGLWTDRSELRIEFADGAKLVRLRRADFARLAIAQLVALMRKQLERTMPSAPLLLASTFPNGPNYVHVLPSPMAGRVAPI